MKKLLQEMEEEGIQLEDIGRYLERYSRAQPDAWQAAQARTDVPVLLKEIYRLRGIIRDLAGI